MQQLQTPPNQPPPPSAPQGYSRPSLKLQLCLVSGASTPNSRMRVPATCVNVGIASVDHCCSCALGMKNSAAARSRQRLLGRPPLPPSPNLECVAIHHAGRPSQRLRRRRRLHKEQQGGQAGHAGLAHGRLHVTQHRRHRLLLRRARTAAARPAAHRLPPRAARGQDRPPLCVQCAAAVGRHGDGHGAGGSYGGADPTLSHVQEQVIEVGHWEQEMGTSSVAVAARAATSAALCWTKRAPPKHSSSLLLSRRPKPATALPRRKRHGEGREEGHHHSTRCALSRWFSLLWAGTSISKRLKDVEDRRRKPAERHCPWPGDSRVHTLLLLPFGPAYTAALELGLLAQLQLLFDELSSRALPPAEGPPAELY